MQKFKVHTARSVEEGLNFLDENGPESKIIAGGTDLIPSLRKEDIHPRFILNILEIKELNGIWEQNNLVRIGPVSTFTEVVESPVINRCFPSLVKAAASVGGPQIRNRGTFGGNVANASPAADVLPALLALGGELEVQSKKGGGKVIPLYQAIAGPYKSRLQPDEMITGIILKKLAPEARCAFEKLGRRNAMARARMNLSLVLCQDQKGIVCDLRIVPGAVMPVARRMDKAERELLGKKPEPSHIEAAAKRLSAEMVEVTGIRWSTEYKVPVLENIFRRVLKQLLAWNQKPGFRSQEQNGN